MKKLIFIFTIYLFNQNVNAQAFSVGNTCCNYNLVNITFTAPCGCFCPSSNNYDIDIDGDLAKDISITSAGSPGCFSAPTVHRISAFSYSGTEIVYTTLPTFCPSTSIIQKMNFGDILKSNLNWKPQQTAPYIYDYYWSISGSWTCGQQITNHYVAFRKILPSNDTIYGWVNVNSNFPGQVIDYAYTCGTYTAAPPTSTITTPPSTICKGDSISLSANPSGGVFSGTGISGNYFKTKNLAGGVYTVSYALPNPNGCSTSASSITFTVLAASITNTQTAICSGESLTLNGTPSGGYFSGTYISGNVFSPTSTGTFATAYTYTNTAGCNSTASVNLISNGCVGVNELTKENDIFKIFPNPNSGEFEIKSSKETNIVITNELGQLVKTVELNSANNYSSKITELQSGVYFIGNNSVRQKIVVIK